MYARVTRFTYNIARRAEFDAEVENLRARIEQLPGMIDIYVCGDDEGNGVAVSLFESPQAAEHMAHFAQAAWTVLEGLYRGIPETHHFDNVTHFPGPAHGAGQVGASPVRAEGQAAPQAAKPRLVVTPARKSGPKAS